MSRKSIDASGVQFIIEIINFRMRIIRNHKAITWPQYIWI